MQVEDDVMVQMPPSSEDSPGPTCYAGMRHTDTPLPQRAGTMKRLTTLILAATALAFLPLTSGLAQEERGITDRPIDVGLVLPDYMAITFVPLENVAQALGSSLQYDQARHHYSVLSESGGILKVNPGAQAAPARAGRPQIRPEAIRRPQPQQIGRPASFPHTTSFSIDDQLVSKGIVIIGGKPHMPLDDLAAAMGAVIEERPSPDGEGATLSLVPQPGASPLLELSERGIIIVGGKEE